MECHFEASLVHVFGRSMLYSWQLLQYSSLFHALNKVNGWNVVTKLYMQVLNTSRDSGDSSGPTDPCHV